MQQGTSLYHEVQSLLNNKEDREAIEAICESNGWVFANFNEQRDTFTELSLFMMNMPLFLHLHLFPNLTKLSLMHLKLKEIDGNEISRLKNLEFLCLAENELKEIKNGLTECKNLKQVKIDVNFFSDLKSLAGDNAFEVVSANSNQITSIVGIHSFKHIRILSLAFNRIENIFIDDGTSAFAFFPELEELNIAGNYINSLQQVHCIGSEYAPKLARLFFSDPTFGVNPIVSATNYRQVVIGFTGDALNCLDSTYVSHDERGYCKFFLQQKHLRYSAILHALERDTHICLKEANFIVRSEFENSVKKAISLRRALNRVLAEYYNSTPNKNSATTAVPLEQLNQLEKTKATLEQAQFYNRTRLHNMMNALDKCNALIKGEFFREISSLFWEWSCYGAVHFEKGHPIRHSWYPTIVDMIKVHFPLYSYTLNFPELGIEGFQVRAITKIHNSYLRTQFDDEMLTTLNIANSKYRACTDYLFFVPSPLISCSRNYSDFESANIFSIPACPTLSASFDVQLWQLFEGIGYSGFSYCNDDNEAHVSDNAQGKGSKRKDEDISGSAITPLTNSVYLADEERLAKLYKKEGKTLDPRTLCTQLLICKVFLGRSVPERGASGGIYSKCPLLANATTSPTERKVPIPLMRAEKLPKLPLNAEERTLQSFYRVLPSDPKQRIWFCFNNLLILPDYIVDINYVSHNTKIPRYPFSNSFLVEKIEQMRQRLKDTFSNLPFITEIWDRSFIPILLWWEEQIEHFSKGFFCNGDGCMAAAMKRGSLHENFDSTSIKECGEQKERHDSLTNILFSSLVEDKDITKALSMLDSLFLPAMSSSSVIDGNVHEDAKKNQPQLLRKQISFLARTRYQGIPSEKLFLSSQGISSLTGFIENFSNCFKIQEIDFSNNELTMLSAAEWEELAKALKSLSKLNLSCNKISKLPTLLLLTTSAAVGGGSERRERQQSLRIENFRSLKFLDLSCNQIDDVLGLATLREWFPHLIDLDVSLNPFLTGMPSPQCSHGLNGAAAGEGWRDLLSVIAFSYSPASLKTLNGTQVLLKHDGSNSAMPQGRLPLYILTPKQAFDLARVAFSKIRKFVKNGHFISFSGNYYCFPNQPADVKSRGVPRLMGGLDPLTLLILSFYGGVDGSSVLHCCDSNVGGEQQTSTSSALKRGQPQPSNFTSLSISPTAADENEILETRELPLLVYNNSFLTSLPDFLFTASSLVHLQLRHHCIINLNPNIIQGLVSLRTCDFRYNFISEIPLGSFSTLKNLYYLDLSHNRIKCDAKFQDIVGKEGASVVEFEEENRPLKTLTYLALDYNQLTSLLPFSAILSLEELFLGNNCFKDEKEIRELRVIPKLQVLDLTANPLGDRERGGECQENSFVADQGYRLYAVFHLKSLRVLDGLIVTPAEVELARETFAGQLTSELLKEKTAPLTEDKWDTMKELSLKGCGLRDLLTLSVRFKSLQHLQLSHNGLTNLIAVKDCAHLVSLNAAYNKLGHGQDEKKIASDLAEALEGLQELISLSLEGNGLKSVQQLSLSRLKFLNLTGNEFTRIAGFNGFPALRELVISRNRIKQLVNEDFNSVPNLRRFYCEQNYIRSVGKGRGWIKSSLKHLTHLSLAENRLTDLHNTIDALTGAPIVYLWLSGNRVAQYSSYMVLVKHLPNLQVLDDKKLTASDHECHWDPCTLIMSPAMKRPLMVSTGGDDGTPRNGTRRGNNEAAASPPRAATARVGSPLELSFSQQMTNNTIGVGSTTASIFKRSRKTETSSISSRLKNGKTPTKPRSVSLQRDLSNVEDISDKGRGLADAIQGTSIPFSPYQRCSQNKSVSLKTKRKPRYTMFSVADQSRFGPRGIETEHHEEPAPNHYQNESWDALDASVKSFTIDDFAEGREGLLSNGVRVKNLKPHQILYPETIKSHAISLRNDTERFKNTSEEKDAMTFPAPGSYGYADDSASSLNCTRNGAFLNSTGLRPCMRPIVKDENATFAKCVRLTGSSSASDLGNGEEVETLNNLTVRSANGMNLRGNSPRRTPSPTKSTVRINTHTSLKQHGAGPFGKGSRHMNIADFNSNGPIEKNSKSQVPGPDKYTIKGLPKDISTHQYKIGGSLSRFS